MASSTRTSPPRPSFTAKPFVLDNSRAIQSHQRKVYPKVVWYVIGACIGFLALSNIVRIIRVQVRKRALFKNLSSTPPEGEPVQSSTKSRASVRNLPRAVEAAFKILAFRWTLPYGFNYVISVSELAVSCGYVAILLIWSFVHTRGLKVAFWNQRIASIAYAQFPLLPLLSGKNNLIGFVTGLSYEKINIIHRTVGRTIFIMVMCHAFNKVPFPTSSLSKEKYYAGVLAASALGGIFLMSLRPVRMHAFEFFLILHIILISVFLAGVYYHQPENALIIWLFIGFWMFDRSFRLFRLLSINQGKPKCTEASIEVISPNAVRLVLPNRDITWKAGQHVFLILPGVSTIPFESHPFTIANIPSGQGASDLVFYIRSMDGFTRKLDNYAQTNNGKSVTALVDGPYGRPPPVNTFSTVVLVAGGSGASFTVPLLLDIVSAARRKQTPVKRVVFIWSLKDSAEVKWAAQTLSDVHNTVPEGLSLDIRIHLTRADSLVTSLDHSSTDEKVPESPDSPVSPKKREMDNVVSGEKVGPSGTLVTTAPADEGRTSDDHVLNTTGGYKTIFGRPNLQATIQEEIAASSGPTLVTGAGPAPLTKAVRASVRSGAAGPSAALHGAYPVSMYIENFGAVRTK